MAEWTHQMHMLSLNVEKHNIKVSKPEVTVDVQSVL